MIVVYVPKFMEGEWHAARLCPGSTREWASGGTALNFHAARSLCRDLNGEAERSEKSLAAERKLLDRRN